MAGVTREEIERARQVDLLNYLELHNPTELKRTAPGHYSTRTHDSVDISNGKWYRWSTGQGGDNALDYLINVEHIPFVEAVRTLNGQELQKLPAHSYEKPTEPRKLLLPKANADNNRVVKYLLGRGIDYEIVSTCINKGYIFESETYHNAIFVGMDDKGVPRYAAYRSTNGERILGDATGSDKRYSFRFMGRQSNTLHLFESAIDALSYMTLAKDELGEAWREGNYISMAGVFAPRQKRVPVGLVALLEERVWDGVYIHFDNDVAGRAATKSLAEALAETGKVCEIVDQKPPVGKDFNDFLCMRNAERFRSVKEDEIFYGR